MTREIIREWVGYNGKRETVKKPDGTWKEVNHDKVWAAAIAASGEILVRYGPAKQPLHLQEHVKHPTPGRSVDAAVQEAERLLAGMIEEKRAKGYDEIPFDVAPHHVPSLKRRRLRRLPDEKDEATEPSPSTMRDLEKTLRQHLEALTTPLLDILCPECKTLHQQYLINLGTRDLYAPATVIRLLLQSQQGRKWLDAPCQFQEMTLCSLAGEVLGMVIDLATGEIPACPARRSNLEKS